MHEDKALAALGLQAPGFASQVHTIPIACHIIMLVVPVKLLQHLQ